eukprot:5334323-Alexandrium_andersonii.AAC.1
MSCSCGGQGQGDAVNHLAVHLATHALKTTEPFRDSSAHSSKQLMLPGQLLLRTGPAGWPWPSGAVTRA